MTPLALFTVFLDFRGGFYIRQVRAADEIEALRAWAAAFAEQKPIPRVSGIIARNALKDLEIIDDYLGMRLPPTPIDTVTDVWCADAKCGLDTASIFIVKTAEPV